MSARAASGLPRRIPLPALTVACVALLLAAWPMVARVPLFAFAVFLGALVARICIHHFRIKLPPLWLKLVVLGLGIGAVFSATGTLIGIESGIGILLILVSLKLLELRNERDFQVLVLLGWFLGLCRLFFVQNLVSWAETIAVSLLMVAALLLFHSREMSLRHAFRTTLVLALQCLPLVALLFLLFPRAYTGVRFSFNRGLIGSTGMADRLEPGSFSGIAQNDDPAFHVAFPDRPPPPAEQRYWRGGVLWKGENLRWTRGLARSWRSAPAPTGGDTYRQIVLVQPHGEGWLFGLDWPVGKITFRDQRDASYEFGEYFHSRAPVLQAMQYEVISQISSDPMPLEPEQREAALQLPRDIPERSAELARQWRRSARTDRAFVDRALRYITDEEFSYTLTPGTYRSRNEGIDEFLFDRRAGFCEHYAASFATLMRLGGIPSRLVIGYRGGELNDTTTPPRIIVRQSDAHAWCEVWLEGSWTRVDPTALIAPERVSQSLQSLLEMRRTDTDGDSLVDGPDRAGWSGLWHRTRMAWDNLNYRWDVDVLNYGEAEQKNFLAVLGLSQLRGIASILLVILLGTVGLGVLAILLRMPWRRRGDPALRAWQRFCRLLARAGLERHPAEGPLAYSQRAAARFPSQAEVIRQIADQYIRLRYRPDPPSLKEWKKLTRRLPAFNTQQS